MEYERDILIPFLLYEMNGKSIGYCVLKGRRKKILHFKWDFPSKGIQTLPSSSYWSFKKQKESSLEISWKDESWISKMMKGLWSKLKPSQIPKWQIYHTKTRLKPLWYLRKQPWIWPYGGILRKTWNRNILDKYLIALDLFGAIKTHFKMLCTLWKLWGTRLPKILFSSKYFYAILNTWKRQKK